MARLEEKAAGFGDAAKGGPSGPRPPGHWLSTAAFTCFYKAGWHDLKRIFALSQSPALRTLQELINIIALGVSRTCPACCLAACAALRNAAPADLCGSCLLGVCRDALALRWPRHKRRHAEVRKPFGHPTSFTYTVGPQGWTWFDQRLSSETFGHTPTCDDCHPGALIKASLAGRSLMSPRDQE